MGIFEINTSKSDLFEKLSKCEKKESFITYIQQEFIDANMLVHKYLYYTFESVIRYLKTIKNSKYKALLNVSTEVEVAKFSTYFEDIKIHSTYNEYDYVSVGCGDGDKDASILKTLNDKLKYTENINYIPLEFSYYLILSAITKVKTKCSNYVDIYPFNVDFLKYQEFIDKFNKTLNSNRHAIFSLFGHTIGNYLETDLLNPISNLMRPYDFLLIGYEVYPDMEVYRRNTGHYDNKEDRDFLKYPLKLLPNFSGHLEEDDNLKFEITKDISYTKIEGCFSVVPTLKDTGINLTLAFSTKYQVELLKQFFKDYFNELSLKYIKNYESSNEFPQYALMILQKQENIQDLKKKALIRIRDLIESQQSCKDELIKIKRDIEGGLIDNEDILKFIIEPRHTGSVIVDRVNKWLKSNHNK